MQRKEMEMALPTAKSAVGRYPEMYPDSTTPACVKPNSKGSGLRLSWPHAGDGRRAVVGKSPSYSSSDRSSARHFSDARIVHVSYVDVQMHYHFAHSGTNESARPILQIPMAWNPLKLEVEDKSLFQYFQCTASRSLATFGYDPQDLGNVLIRIALASNTTSATAVLQTLLALSSLHRHNVQSQAAELKISALKALAAAAGSHVGTTEAIQHVAAGMLLCSFEIHQASCTSSEWTWYLSGVKDVIKSAGLDRFPQNSDLAILLDWVYYHDVLARFTLQHWHRKTTGISSTALSIRAKVSHTAPSALASIELLSEVCDAVSSRRPAESSAENSGDHKSFLKILDWRIRSMPMAATVDGPADAPQILELYQLAMLVYLNRASENLLNQATRTQQQVDKAFVIFSQLSVCNQQFPVFTLGCEARGDDQRKAVLDLISRTERNGCSRSFNFVKILMQAIWAQDDLANGDINYWDKLSYIISCCSIIPTFV